MGGIEVKQNESVATHRHSLFLPIYRNTAPFQDTLPPVVAGLRGRPQGWAGVWEPSDTHAGRVV